MKNVSIIIPTKNIPDLLDRCLSSIPDCDAIEIIIVDDNSSSLIVDFDHYPKSKNSNVTLIRTTEGKGAGYARNKGLDIATGKWLIFADSDDFFVEGFYDIILKYIDSSADMVLFKAGSVNSETLEPSKRSEIINRQIENALKGSITAAEASITVQSPWCRLIKRSFVEKNKIRFDEVVACNDTMFTTKATCLAGKILVCNECLYVVTYRNRSLWNQRKTDPNNILIRLDVQIRRNIYVRKFGFNAVPILGYLLKASKFGINTFFKALGIILRKGALFQGVSCYFKK